MGTEGPLAVRPGVERGQDGMGVIRPGIPAACDFAPNFKCVHPDLLRFRPLKALSSGDEECTRKGYLLEHHRLEKEPLTGV